MMMLAQLLLTLTGAPVFAPMASDTIRIEVGAKELDGRVYAPHAARVRVWVGPGEGTMRAEWTNVLTVGDSAGRHVHRWYLVDRSPYMVYGEVPLPDGTVQRMTEVELPSPRP